MRSFYEESAHGASRIEVYFYNRKDHPLNENSRAPVTDRIKIYFDNDVNTDGEVAGEGILINATVSLAQNRVNVSEDYKHVANAKKISLKEAEELLIRGHVFGGNSCPLCMEMQDPVAFEHYDFVDLEYLSEVDFNADRTKDIAPFYAFYKRIGTTKHGCEVYAKTYVPAVEVSGFEEYFESKKNNHGK